MSDHPINWEWKEYYAFLFILQESGITNMLGAVPYLREYHTRLTEKEGRAILLSWCENWKEIHEEMMKEEDE
tara:strand:- start:366 stop:581 length:216 start_codon:yes stop_codon:yes gene_type:complete